jgi:mercuric reductase
VLQRSNHILPTESEDITNALTGYLTEEGLEILTGAAVEQVHRGKQGVVVRAKINDEKREFTAAQILVATGRKPNTRNIGLERAGVLLDEHGFIEVSPTLQTTLPGIWAAGDVLGQNMFVYTAAYEGALAAENALTKADRLADYTALPWVVFTDPQVAGIGMDERQARAAGRDAEVATLPLSYVPRAIAARDSRGLIKLIRDKKTDLLLGARILAPEGSELLMELAMAIKFGITVRQIRESFHAYLTLSEGVKLAAITFGKDVAQLSCCAT